MEIPSLFAVRTSDLLPAEGVPAALEGVSGVGDFAEAVDCFLTARNP